jgi:hypothetical protein
MRNGAIFPQKLLLVSLCLIVQWSELLMAEIPAGGKVTVNYTFTRINKIASNQFAVWIEDETGRYVRTLFATDFMARRQGWKIRTDCCPAWIAAADVKNSAQQAIDAISGPTPQSGPLTSVWDLKDTTGKAVAAGVYSYRIEGNIYWANIVLWTGKIRVGEVRETSRAEVSYSPEGADKEGTLISDVSAVYEPGAAASVSEEVNRNSPPCIFRVDRNFPNPFNSGTTISYQLYRPAEVHVDIFSVLGAPVRHLAGSVQKEGYYRVYWDGCGEDGRSAASGVYFARFRIDHQSEIVSMHLLR